jgi:alkanesulfonate monooxygenase SsuD/methylene tetrahydromethanopterin reductase-like flavin-dependent oxidoreductase (luciferase family)
MEIGVHLPLLDFRGEGFSSSRIRDAAETARDLGFDAISANDHMLFPRPWIDGLSALASVVGQSGDLPLATTTVLPVIRGPVPTAKALAALDLLSGGRLVPSLGPGSSERDYAAVGVPFEERWARYDECVRIVRGLLRGEAIEGPLRFNPEPPPLEPRPGRAVPIWIASWGSEAGLRRVARLGDGWLASAYNTYAEDLSRGRAILERELEAGGRDPKGFPAAVATMWTWVAGGREEAEEVLREILVPMLGRPADELRDRVAVGTPAEVAGLLAGYAAAGCDRVYMWPLGDESRQLELIAREVFPLAERPASSG